MNNFLTKLFRHKHEFSIGDYQNFMLKDGHHTAFNILECKCGKKQAFPNSNLEIALNEGTNETMQGLKSLGFTKGVII